MASVNCGHAQIAGETASCSIHVEGLALLRAVRFVIARAGWAPEFWGTVVIIDDGFLRKRFLCQILGLFLLCATFPAFVTTGRSQTSSGAVDATVNGLARSPNTEVRRLAELLQTHFCNQPAALQLIQTLHRELNYKPASDIGEAFLAKCSKDDSIGFFTMQGWFRLTEFNRALTTIDIFKEDVRSSAQFASWRGFILEKLNRNLEAAADFERALYLFSDLADLSGTQFYYVTRTLKAAGRYCEAMHPLELYLSFDAQQRKTSEIVSILADLQRLGRCAPDVPSGSNVIKMRSQGGLFVVSVQINGVAGSFVIDTGASTVHLTKNFAARASITISDDNMVTIRGATGTRRDYVSKAAKIAIGPAAANDVAVTVAFDDFSLGSGIDGLLGQTFLSRYKVYVDAVAGTLALQQR